MGLYPGGLITGILRYIDLYAVFGTEWMVSNELLKRLEQFDVFYMAKGVIRLTTLLVTSGVAPKMVK